MSERDEDVFLNDYFGDETGYFVDIGANNGVKGSNTLRLLCNGWSGLMVEADPFTYSHLLANFAEHKRVRLLHAAISDRTGSIEFYSEQKALCSGWSTAVRLERDHIDSENSAKFVTCMVPSFTLNDVLRSQPPVDFLTIDTEGMDATILEAWDAGTYRPRLIMAETACAVVPDAAERIGGVMVKAGYVEVYRNEANTAWERT